MPDDFAHSPDSTAGQDPPSGQTARELAAANRKLGDRISELEALQDRCHAIVETMRRVMAATNRAASVEEAIAHVLPELGRVDGVGFARAWLVGEEGRDALVARGPSWAADPEFGAAVAAASPKRWLPSDSSLVADVMAGDETPRTTSDLGAVVGSENAARARAEGLSRAVIVPVVAGQHAVGVIELLLGDGSDEQQEAIELATIIGSQVGWVVERSGLQKKLSDLGEEEQRRLGQELHDTVAQEIAGIKFLAETLASRLVDDSEAAATATEVASAAADAQQHVRAIARGLVPLQIASGGLRAALRQLAERIESGSDVRLRLEIEDNAVVEDRAVATNLYYVAQEAVINARRHAEADEIHVSFRRDGERLVLTVRDDGRGFRLDELDSSQYGGLRIMAYRTRVIGARFDVDSEPGGGTTVTCSVRLV